MNDEIIAAISAVTEPDGPARGLPNACYTSTKMYELERDQIMIKTWVAVAFGSDVANPGDAFPVSFMGIPLLIVRNKEQQLKVFHNVCSHRGMTLVNEPTRLRTVIRCPYHSWSYDLSGDLISTPLIGGTGKNHCDGFSPDEHGLRSVRFTEWLGIIFVNLSGDGPSFAEFIAPVQARWNDLWGNSGGEQFAPAESGSKMQLDVKCNWKLAVENYCEAYHLPWVHPALNDYSPLQQHFNIYDDPDMAGQGTYHYDLPLADGKTLPKVPDWNTKRIRHAEYLSLYPNALLGVQADHAFAVIVVPYGPAKSRERLQIVYAHEAAGETFADSREEVLASWDKIFSEDIHAVEGMQQGRHSPAYDGGILTPIQDLPTKNFHTWVARQYLAVLQEN